MSLIFCSRKKLIQLLSQVTDTPIWWVMAPLESSSSTCKVSLLLTENTVCPPSHFMSVMTHDTQFFKERLYLVAQFPKSPFLLMRSFIQHRSVGEMDGAGAESVQHTQCLPEDDLFLLVLTQCAWPEHVCYMFPFLRMGF